MRRPTLASWIGLGLAGVLGLSACGGSSPKPTTHPSSTPTATTPLTVSTGTQTATTPGGGSLPAGGPVPAGTWATSVTFISPATAFVLGTAPCDVHPCSAILRTTDRGAHWVGLAAPREAISYPLGDGLWGLRFADASHGYAFGQGLWETANGARSWQKATAPARTVLSLEAVQDRELVAVAQACSPGQGCGGKIGIYHEPVGGTWTRAVSVAGASATASIAVHGQTVWVVAANRVYYSTNGASTFISKSVPSHCRVQTNSITDDGSHVYLLCTGSGFTGHTIKYVYATSGPSAPWILVGKPPTPGDGGQISAGSDTSIVIASYSAASWLYRSTNGGHTWRTVLTENDGGAGWSDLGFTTATNAVVVHGPAVQDGAGNERPGKLLLSSTGGLTWHAAGL